MDSQWFQHAKLGIFIHYGIYAVNGISESWSFYNGRISYEDYMKQLDGFYAERFDASRLADLIERSGARYSVLTAKHHDGVALFDTRFSDLSVVKKTPARRDLIKEYAAAVKEKGIRLGIYYSLLDWSHPDYSSVYEGGRVPEDLSGVNPFTSPVDGVQDEEKWKRFLEFDRNQLKELLTNYGEVDLIWFDGDWERDAVQWGLPGFKKYLKDLNPEIIINSRLQGYGDYQTPEQGIPITRPKGLWEFCTTINESWGYQPADDNYKSLNQVVRIFCDCISMGGNLLLDIGPRGDGSIDPRQESILLGLGAWIREHEEAVYDTAEGILPCYYAGGSVVSEDRKSLYLFVTDEPKESVCLKGLMNEIKRVTVLHSGKELSCQLCGGAPWLGIPGTVWVKMTGADCHRLITVLKVELEGELKLYSGEGAAVTHN